MSEDDVLFGYRLRVLDYAARTSVSEACRVFGIHRSTYYVWKRRVERHGLEILRPRERRRPRLPNQLSPFVEQRIVAFALGHPGFRSDDVLFGYRLRVLDYAARTSVSEACRVFGIHRSTYYVWKRRVERHGLEILRPRERRRPRLPNQLSPFVEQRIVAFALGHPGF